MATILPEEAPEIYFIFIFSSSKAFKEENIKIKYISGASSGSIVATLHAIGYGHEEIYELFKKYANQIKYLDFRNILKGTLRVNI